MYFVARNPRNRRSHSPMVLRPSQRYLYAEPRPIENAFSAFGSPLGEPLPEQIRRSWSENKDNQKIFEILRQQKTFPLDSTARAALKEIFPSSSDDLWLAETLAMRGPEPLWPLAEIKHRVQRVMSIGPDPGNYRATLPDPDPGGRLTGDLAACVDSLKDSQLPSAFFFPGRDARRALIISGVHGDETNGVEVVKSLRTLLATAGKPFFTTILVPIVVPRTEGKARNVSGGMGMNTKGAVVCRSVEPNRNFPLPGEDYGFARNRGVGGPKAQELVIRDRCRGTIRPPVGDEKTSIRMLPETRILITLIERFQPERLASIHDHRLLQRCHPCFARDTLCGGEGPGIFVDPRGISPETGRITNAAQVKADDQLARRMVTRALNELPGLGKLTTSLSPFAGNQALTPPTVRYFSEQRVEGNSLGDWAPVPTVARPGITTLTIELPREGFVDSRTKKRVINLHRDLLKEIFLEP